MKDLYKSIDYSERIDLELRSLYSSKGYKRFNMSKFEEYDLYTKNKDFIPSDDIITIPGENGKLLALRPDLTLSIVKYFRPSEKDIEKIFYSEKIYRSGKDGSYKELNQTGLECLGKIKKSDVTQVVVLAAQSLKTISNEFIMDISHMGFLQEIMMRIPEVAKEDILKAISSKNGFEINNISELYGIPDAEKEAIKEIALSYGGYKDVLAKLQGLNLSKKAQECLGEIRDICNELSKKSLGGQINIDFSIVNNMKYYSGILFRGYVPGISKGILSGGRYDGVMERMGKAGGAIGFALYLDDLDGWSEGDSKKENKKKVDEYINIALPKGRLGNKVYDMFEKAGYPCPAIKEDNRKLVFENKRKKIRYFLVKPQDVTVYVERGTADIGVCGSDIIKEYKPDIYELLDLKKGKCTMSVAAKKGFKDNTSQTLRVATKFPEIAREYYEKESRNIDIIKLHGSIELAPVLGLADVIVDIVETGKTLKENNLEPIYDILNISARLIVNKSSYKFKNDKISEIAYRLGKEITK